MGLFWAHFSVNKDAERSNSKYHCHSLAESYQYFSSLPDMVGYSDGVNLYCLCLSYIQKPMEVIMKQREVMEWNRLYNYGHWAFIMYVIKIIMKYTILTTYIMKAPMQKRASQYILKKKMGSKVQTNSMDSQ